MADYQLTPVDHDPFADAQNSDAALAASMTHRPEQRPEPYMHPNVPVASGYVRDYLHGGVPEVLQNRGIALPDWVNRTNEFLHRDDVNTALGVMTPLKGAGMLPKVAGMLPKVAEEASVATKPSITAYHGSPHDFDKFDLSKIGTGTGIEAHGKGLYFAEDKKVAAGYRNLQSALPRDLTPAQNDAALAIRRLGGNRQEAIDELREIARRWERNPGSEKVAAGYHEAADLVESGWEPPISGHLYGVKINADPDHFLDWHAPLSEQSDHVQNAIKAVMPDVDESLRGSRLYRNLEKSGTVDKLREAGIPGIKYEGESAMGGAHEGTRNYVVFDDKIIDILKKYGIPGLMAEGAYHFRTSPVDHDPFAEK